MRIAALCDRDTAVGFRLAGVKDIFVPEGNEKELWFNITEQDDIGLIFITEEIAERIEKYIKDFRIRNDVPIVVEIPDKKGHKKDHINFVSQLIKRAVGIEIIKR